MKPDVADRTEEAFEDPIVSQLRAINQKLDAIEAGMKQFRAKLDSLLQREPLTPKE
jgi:hypothetical protein